MIELHLVCHVCWISIVTLLPWLLYFYGYALTMVAGFQWLPCYHGCWSSVVTLFTMDFHGFPLTIVPGFSWLLCYHGCWYSVVTLLPWLRYKLSV